MRAALCKAFGGIDDLAVETLPDPVPGPGEVVVDVAAAALNFFDTLIVRNRYQYTPDLPFSPSAEVAGRVSAVGADVPGWQLGDRVCAYLVYGGAREKVVVKAERLVAIPDGVDDVTASGLTVTYGTGIHGLLDRGQVGPGDTVAVLGASGGAGLAAVELSKLLGAEVIAVASSDEKLAICAAHGADKLVNYSGVDGAAGLKDQLRDATGGAGVSVVYDCVGGDFAEPALRALKWGGRFLVIGFAAGDIPKIPLNLVLLKGISVVGVFWGAFLERDMAAHRTHTERLLAWCATGELKPRIHGTFPLNDIQAALGLIKRREAVGKVVLTM